MGSIGGVAERLAQLIDRSTQGMIEIHYDFGTPDTLPQFLARHQFAGTLDEGGQNFEWLPLQVHAYTVLTQLSGAQVGFKYAEANLVRLYSRRHNQMVQRD